MTFLRSTILLDLRACALTSALALALLPTGCGPRPMPELPPMEDDDPAAGREREREPLPEPPPEVEALPAGGTLASGTIAHADLVVMLEAGPASFLGKVSPEPSFVRGRFAGWKIGAVPRGAGGFGSVDLQPGDIVLKVNGKTVERPEAFQEMWDAMRFAERLVVEVERNGAPHRLDFAIVHDASAPPVSAPPGRAPKPKSKR